MKYNKTLKQSELKENDINQVIIIDESYKRNNTIRMFNESKINNKYVVIQLIQICL